jgi:hypothetical protein
MAAFTEVLQEREGAESRPGAPVFVVPESWRQGRSTLGGLVAAIALRGEPGDGPTFAQHFG